MNFYCKIYDQELEKVPEFKDCFNETLEKFELIKGKYDESNEKNVQCYFKVSVLFNTNFNFTI